MVSLILFTPPLWSLAKVIQPLWAKICFLATKSMCATVRWESHGFSCHSSEPPEEARKPQLYPAVLIFPSRGKWWLPGNYSTAQSCAACSMIITDYLVEQCSRFSVQRVRGLIPRLGRLVKFTVCCVESPRVWRSHHPEIWQIYVTQLLGGDCIE